MASDMIIKIMFFACLVICALLNPSPLLASNYPISRKPGTAAVSAASQHPVVPSTGSELYHLSHPA